MFMILNKKINKEIIKQAKSITPDYWGGIEKKIPSQAPVNFTFKRKPLLIISVITLMLILTVTVYATSSGRINNLINVIWGEETNTVVNGNIINKNVYSNGINLTVDATMVENNSVLLFYTLTDKEQNIFKNKIYVDECSFTADKNITNFGRSVANYNVNGKPNCIVFNFKSLELLNKKNMDFSFSISSLRQAEDVKEYTIPLKDGSEGFEKESGFELVSCKINGSLASIAIKKPKEYMTALPIIRNKITHQEYIPETQNIHDEVLYTYAYNTSEKIDDNFEIVIKAQKVFTFDSPIKADFKISLDNFKHNIIKPDSLYIESAKVQSIDISQMSVMVDLVAPTSPSDELYLKQRISIQYDDGKTSEKISDIMTSKNEKGEFKYLVTFNTPIDYNRHPVLNIGSKSIPLS
ncbi:DUF4179 domain-containing protein [Ruminiclostridium papyrosolvens]|uniref:DUF4179 domain-containing protein n=1 Tax=Ruminiclostridium papyrosolvens C7 TaxID=1330534 RepID=U4QX62_9FIRM|nr:DUF4179 domain-containing protein [Ruminiclostridium papyrosolvens]EPR07490.1 hypothetical protein L323_20340 [Ruminiclostridium papyrosolvens C7]